MLKRQGGEAVSDKANNGTGGLSSMSFRACPEHVLSEVEGRSKESKPLIISRFFGSFHGPQNDNVISQVFSDSALVPALEPRRK